MIRTINLLKPIHILHQKDKRDGLQNKKEILSTILEKLKLKLHQK